MGRTWRAARLGEAYVVALEKRGVFIGSVVRMQLGDRVVMGTVVVGRWMLCVRTPSGAHYPIPQNPRLVVLA